MSSHKVMLQQSSSHRLITFPVMRTKINICRILRAVNKKKVMLVYYWASCEMLFFVKVLVSGFRTPFTLHQVPETLFLNGGIKEFVYVKKKKKKKIFAEGKSYRKKIVGGIRLYMGWSFTPDLKHTQASSTDSM